MAITRTKQAKQMLRKGGRIGLKGGADASMADFDASANPDRPGGPIGRTGPGPAVGAGGASFNKDDNFQTLSTIDKDVRDRQKKNYEQQFFDKGIIPPAGGRPLDFKTRLNRRNLQKRLNYINYLEKEIRDKINKGLIDYQTEEGQITGLTDFDTLSSYIDQVQSVQDLVDKGFYKKDGAFAKGEKIPDFPSTDLPGLMKIVQDKFAGPVTSDRLKELAGQVSKLKGLKTTEGLENTTFKELMKEFQPNRYELEYGDPKDDDKSPETPTDPCKGPNPPPYCFIGDKADDTMEAQKRNLGGLSPRFGGSIFDFEGLADGGRAGFRIGSDSGKDTSGREYGASTAAAKSVSTSPSRNKDDSPPTSTGGGIIKVPGPIKDAGNLAGELMFLKNAFELNPIGIMKNIGSKLILDKLISEGETQDKNTLLADVSAMDIKRKGQLQSVDYETAKDIGMINPTMTKEEFEGVKSGQITEPTGQFARDGGRIGAMEGGIMDLETGRQMYFLGKLVKKATRAVKKIVKSPIGKAAILGGAAYFGAPLFKSGAFKNFFLKDAAKGFALKNISGAGIASIIGGASLLPLIFGDKEEDQVELDRGPMLTREQLLAIRGNPFGTLAPRFGGSQFAFAADGGRIGYQEGSKEPVAKKTMPLLDMGGQEMDLRAEGGFVPIGRMEKADDVPARLSKNEFVFTADAVRNAGDGSVDKGAEVMYNMMKNLEAGGSVSKESQGQEGARRMFQTSKRLEEVL
jgi:hypothetical protein